MCQCLPKAVWPERGRKRFPNQWLWHIQLLKLAFCGRPWQVLPPFFVTPRHRFLDANLIVQNGYEKELRAIRLRRVCQSNAPNLTHLLTGQGFATQNAITAFLPI
jgi:hypothetical protein